MTNNLFDNDAFLDWLDDQQGPIRAAELHAEWPDFPITRLAGCTGPIVNGKMAYYTHDLRRIAEGRGIID